MRRHVTRWAPHARDPEALARQAAALLLSLPGCVCLYQGEELALPESELEFEELTDPPGIRFRPEYKGRDFYIAGESYGGHYVPQLATVIKFMNELHGTTFINLRGIFVSACT